MERSDQGARASSVDLGTPLSSPNQHQQQQQHLRRRSRTDSVASGAEEHLPPVGSGPATPTPTSSRPTGRVRPAGTGSSGLRKYLPAYKIVLLGDTAVGKSNLLNRFAKGTFNELSRATIGMEFVSREVDLSCAAPTLTENFHDVDGFASAVTPSQATNSGYHSPAAESETSPDEALRDDEPSTGSNALQHRRGLSLDLSLSGNSLNAGNNSLNAGKRAGGGASPIQPGSASVTPPPAAQPPCQTHFERIMLQLWDTAGQEANAALSAVYYRGARGVAVVYDVTRRETLYNVGRWVASARRHCDDSCVICVIGNKTDLRHSVAVPEEEARDLCHALGCRHYLASAMNGEGVEHAFLQLLLAVHAEATVRGVANDLPNGVDIVRRVGGSRGTLTAVDSGEAIAGFRLSKKEARKKRFPCCGANQ